MPTANSRITKVLGGVALLFLLAAILVAVLIGRFAASPALKIAQLKKAGLPASVTDLNSYYAPVPASSNAALGILKAIDELTIPGLELRNEPLPKPGQPLTPKFKAALREYLATNALTLQLVEDALRLPASRYPLTFTGNVPPAFPHLGDLKTLVMLQGYQTIQFAVDQDAAAAVSSLEKGFRLAATLQDEPTLISRLVYVATVAMNLGYLERLLEETTPPEAELARIAALLERTEQDCARSAARALIGERAIGIDGLKTTFQSAALSPNVAAKMKGFLYRLLRFEDRDFELYLELMQGLIEAAGQPFPEAYRETMRLQRQMQEKLTAGLGRFAVLTRMSAPAVTKMVLKEAALHARLRCAQTAVAAERFRLKEKSHPASVEELTPQFLARVALDPVGGQPLEIKRIENGVVISAPVAIQKLENTNGCRFVLLPP